MTFVQHGASTVVGFLASASAVHETTNLPASKGEVIALVSAVLVQGLIYGVNKLFSWLKKKNDKKETPQPTPII